MLIEHFLVTPVTPLPKGKEKGKFLSIDVGGTNLRVGFVELIGEPDGGVVKLSHRYSYRQAGVQDLPPRAAGLFMGWNIYSRPLLDHKMPKSSLVAQA